MRRTIGIERERFITNSKGKVVAAIGDLLPVVHRLAQDAGLPLDRFTHELFGGQIEDRTPPCLDLNEVRESLFHNDQILRRAADELGLGLNCSEMVDPGSIVCLEVNPFDERHQQIWQSISPERRVAASVVAAVHVHISVEQADVVRVLNRCDAGLIEKLVALGDHSNQRRIDAYREMAETNGVPPRFSSYHELTEYIGDKGGEKNVWDLVRYKPSTQTIEFRMFGATADLDEIIGYITASLEIF